MIKLSSHSKKKLEDTFELWRVDKDFSDPMFNYLVYGWSPGSCFTAVLANDFARAIQTSHPANSIPAFKALTGWIGDHVPRNARGSYENVDRWIKLDPHLRRAELELKGLIYTEKQETWLALSKPEHA